MEKYKKYISAMIVAVVLFGGVLTVKAYSGDFLDMVAEKVACILTGCDVGNIGATGFTQQTSNQKYTESQDLYQNVQAMSERMASGSQYAILQSNAAGSMERVLPSALAGSDWTFSANTRASSFVETGSAVTINATTTLTAAQVCDSGVILGYSTDATNPLQITLPNSTTLFADCLSTIGDSTSLPFYNWSSATNTLIVVGGGGGASPSSTLTVLPSNLVELWLVRTSTAGYALQVK